MNTENVEFCWNSIVVELLHEDRLTGVRLKNVLTGEERIVECDGSGRWCHGCPYGRGIFGNTPFLTSSGIKNSKDNI